MNDTRKAKPFRLLAANTFSGRFFIGVSTALTLLCSSVTLHAQDGVVIKGERGSESRDVRLGEERYGPISSADTLWTIAERFRPHSSVSQYQTMVAIAQANPRAFANGNLNRMLDGFYLRIPSLQEIQMVNPEAARRQVLVDQQLQEKAEQIKQQQSETESIRAQQTQMLVDARQQAQQAVAEVRQQQQQEFTELREQVSQSMTALERVYSENSALQQRLDELKTQIDDLQQRMSDDGELQQQLQQLVAQQEQMLAEQRRQQQLAEQNSWSQWFSSPLNIALMSLLPAALIIALLYFVFMRRREQPTTSDNVEVPEQTREMSDEEAAAALDRELMGSGDEQGNDLLALDNELTDRSGNTDDDGLDLSSLEDEMLTAADADDMDVFAASELPADKPADEPQTTPVDDVRLDDDEDDSLFAEDDGDASGELSQDELDQLFAEDGEPAIDFSIDTDAEPAPAASDKQPQPDHDSSELASAEEQTAASTDDDALSTDAVGDDELEGLLPEDFDNANVANDKPATDSAIAADEDAEEELSVDDMLSELGVDEAETEQVDTELESLLAESERLQEQLQEQDDSADVEEDVEREAEQADDAVDESRNDADSGDDGDQEIADVDDIDALLADVQQGEPAAAEPTQDEADDDEAVDGAQAPSEEPTQAASEELSEEQIEDAEQQADEALEDLFEQDAEQDFVDIDALIDEASAAEDDAADPYDKSSIEQLLPGDTSGADTTDSDDTADEEDSLAAQLDLAQAYIEMEDYDEAVKLLDQIIAGDDEELAAEASALKQRIQS
ncbi:FimV/HubP family polar landmark protein [Idiomarina xiamenensis]|uniref:Tfp pilus assembly protein FimV n=1 Tax=Idiomarina xiamenensis 10-D-4 TaxID=740709 RepID=K2KN05_9GAMM|nr:FimV/HubP family polar landmark protein [Idiomarina xiamenensis]EKE83839.1 Tfp pilus assembly protein FimV [Idiomarina xiamenensis 10-D-4]